MIADYTGREGNAVAIDPPGCGCTECMVGESVPLDDSSLEELAQQAIMGRPLINNCEVALVLDYTTETIYQPTENRWRYPLGEVTPINQITGCICTCPRHL